MNIKSKQIAIKNTLLIAMLFGLVTINKELFRPGFSHVPFLNILTGSFPNFIAAFIISLALINGVLVKNPRNRRVIAYIGSALVFIILTIEEFKPIWGASEYFDSFDILASGLGSLLSISIFEIILYTRKQKLK
jgi:hypothetical protein